MGLFGFESFCGPWYLRLGNVKMSQAILELCQVTQEARPTVSVAWMYAPPMLVMSIDDSGDGSGGGVAVVVMVVVVVVVVVVSVVAAAA